MIPLLAVWILICLLMELYNYDMTKPKIKRYYQPTPKKWRKLGDSILFAGTTMTGYAIMNESHTFALISLSLTVLGKTLTNFATDDDTSDSSDNIG